MQDFAQLLRRLADADFPFVIIGGYAAVIHRSSLVTRDLDICSVLTDTNIPTLRNVLGTSNRLTA